MLLEKTLALFPRETRVAVLTGDIQTDNDAQRLARYGFPVRQITTGGSCHLDARMVERALEGWNLESLDYLFIENVGNLVCPSSYDLGENNKIVILSTTEGEDKPLKYPATFSRAGLVILNKIDLLPYVTFDMALARENIRKVNPTVADPGDLLHYRRGAHSMAGMARNTPSRFDGSPLSRRFELTDPTRS